MKYKHTKKLFNKCIFKDLSRKLEAGWPLTASKWPNIISDKRIEILTLINLCLDIYKGILVLNPYISTIPGWPLTASSSLQVAKYLPIFRYNKGILVLNPYKSTVPGWPLTASSSLQVAKYYF